MNEDKGTRYQRLKRRAGALNAVWSVVLLVGVMTSGVSAALRGLASSAAASGPVSVRSAARRRRLRRAADGAARGVQPAAVLLQRLRPRAALWPVQRTAARLGWLIRRNP